MSGLGASLPVDTGKSKGGQTVLRPSSHCVGYDDFLVYSVESWALIIPILGENKCLHHSIDPR